MRHHIKPSPRALAALLIPIVLPLCAAAPPREGAELRGGVGADAYEVYTGGCGSTRYLNRAATGRAHGQVTYRSASGATGAAEVNLSVGTVHQSIVIERAEADQNPAPEGSAAHLMTLALRVGYHGRYGGIEGGLMPTVGNTLSEFEGAQFLLLPSVRGWLGVPELVYVWADVLAGPTLGGVPGSGLGLGHASKTLRVELGYSPNAITSHAEFKLSEQLWLGAKLQAMPRTISDEDVYTYGALVTFAMPLDAE